MYFIPGNERGDFDMAAEAEALAGEALEADLDHFVGEDWREREAETADPERFVPEALVEAPTAQDAADLQWVLDYEAGALPWQ